jgi:hypothetical protein
MRRLCTNSPGCMEENRCLHFKMSGSLPYHRKFSATSGLSVSKAIALKDLRASEPATGRLKLTKLYARHSALMRSPAPSVTGACLPEAGYNVVCTDVDTGRIAQLLAVKVPIWQKGQHRFRGATTVLDARCGSYPVSQLYQKVLGLD